MMTPFLTPNDVTNAVFYADRRAQERPLSSSATWGRDVAEALNQKLEERHAQRWRRMGYWVQAIGATSCLAGVTLAISTQELELGLIGTVLGFVIGLVGYGMTSDEDQGQ